MATKNKTMLQLLTYVSYTMSKIGENNFCIKPNTQPLANGGNHPVKSKLAPPPTKSKKKKKNKGTPRGFYHTR